MAKDSHEHHDHDHEHDHSHGHSHDLGQGKGGVPSSLKWALGITLSFMLVEAVGGWWTGSLALLSDALHMFTDSGALLLSVFTLWLAARPAGEGYTFGYQRLEILGALLNGLLIWLLSGFLIYESIERFQSPRPLDGLMIAGVAVIGLAANLASLFFLHRDHDHSLNLRAAYLHVLGDLLGSVAAIISGLTIYFFQWAWVDPAVTVLIALLILWSSWRLVREAVEVLLERVPRGISEKKVQERLLSIPGVTEVHDLHIWTLSSGLISLSVHLLASRHDGLLPAARALLDQEFGIKHTTIQIESQSDRSGAECESC